MAAEGSADAIAATQKRVVEEFEPVLALYKCLELRRKAGVRTFLYRNLVYVALERPRRSYAKKSLESIKSKGATRKRSRQFPEQSYVVRGNVFVLTIIGLRCAPEHMKKLKQAQSVLLCISLFSSIAAEGFTLVESYEAVAQVFPSNQEIPMLPKHLLEIPFEYNFSKRGFSEDLHLVIHVYPMTELVSASIPLNTFRAVVRSEGSLRLECEGCDAKRNAYRENRFRLWNLPPPEDTVAPHVMVPSMARRASPVIINQGVRPIAYFEIRLWGAQDGMQHRGCMKLETTGIGMRLSGSCIELDFQWERNIRAAHVSSDSCCDLPLKGIDAVRHKKPYIRPSLAGVKDHDQVLPMTVRWETRSRKYFEEVLIHFRCPVCSIWAGSWDGVFAHLISSHDRIKWSRHAPRLIVGLFDVNVFLNGTMKHEWRLNGIPKRLRYFHVSDGFTPYENIDDASSNEGDDSWRSTAEAISLDDFEDISKEEKEVMLIWNKHIHKVSRGSSECAVVTVATVLDFIDENRQLLSTKNLEANVILVFITLRDFGLLTSDDVLACAKSLRRASSNSIGM